MMFEKLKRVREHLASCKAVNIEPATFQALEEALEELDDAMVMETRALQYRRIVPQDSNDYVTELLARYEMDPASNPALKASMHIADVMEGFMFPKKAERVS